MFQMTILYLHLFNYSRQHKSALILKKNLGLRKHGTLCFKYLELFEDPNSYMRLREGSKTGKKTPPTWEKHQVVKTGDPMYV